MADDRPSRTPIDWRRSHAPVFHAGPLPKSIPTPRPQAATPMPIAPSPRVDLLRDSLVPLTPAAKAPLTPEPSQPAVPPAPTPVPDMTVRPLPAAAPIPEPAPEASRSPEPSAPVVTPSFAQPVRRSRVPLVAGGALAAVLVAGVAVWLLLPKAETPPSDIGVLPAASAPPASTPPVATPVVPEAVAASAPAADAVATPVQDLQERPSTARTPGASEPRREIAPTSTVQSEAPPAAVPEPAQTPPPAIVTAPLIQPATPAGPPPPSEPTPRTQGDAIVTGPR